MGREIHCIEQDGELWYREWSTIVDAYVSTPTRNHEALRELIAQEAEANAREQVERGWEDRVKRATLTGTSSRLGNGRSKNEWEDEKNPLPEEEVWNPDQQDPVEPS